MFAKSLEERWQECVEAQSRIIAAKREERRRAQRRERTVVCAVGSIVGLLPFIIVIL